MADEITPYHVVRAQPDVRLPWHAGDWGRNWDQAHGVMDDAFVDAALLAVRARWISTSPIDALALHGEMSGWDQAPGETTSEYRRRLKKRWYLARWRGTAKGIIDALAFLGMPNVEVKEAFTAGWGRAGGDRTKMKWFWPVIRQPHPFGTDYSATYGDGTKYGGGKLYGVNGDPRLLELLRRLVRKMKPAHAYCRNIIIVLSGDIVDGTGTTSDGNPTAGSKVAYLGGI